MARRGPRPQPRIKIYRQEPSPAEKRGRVLHRVAKEWDPQTRALRSCFHCKTPYRNASYAWRCEHWHERRP